MVFLLIVILFLFGYLSLFNGKEIDLLLSRTTSIHTTASAIVIASFILGMLLMALVSLVREAGRIYRDWQRRNLVNNENMASSLVEKGDFEMVKGNVAKARVYYIDAIAKGPSNMPAYIKLAESYIASDDGHDAIKVLLKVKYQESENIQLLLTLHRAYSMTGDIGSMVDIAKKLASIDEENQKFLTLLRDAYIGAEKPEEAYRTQKIIMKLAKDKSGYAAERHRLGELKYEYALSIHTTGDIDLSLKKLGDVKKLNPDFAPAYVSAGDFHLNDKDDVEGAVDEWKSGYSLTHNAVFLIRIEDVYLKHDNPFELIRFYRGLLSDRPDDNLARIMFAKLMLRLEMIDDAEEQISYLDNTWVHVPSMDIISAEIMAKRGDPVSAFKRLRSVMDNGVQMKFPYVCSICGQESTSWSARCTKCRSNNSLAIRISKELETLEAAQSRDSSLAV